MCKAKFLEMCSGKGSPVGFTLSNTDPEQSLLFCQMDLGSQRKDCPEVRVVVWDLGVLVQFPALSPTSCVTLHKSLGVNFGKVPK